MGQIGVKVWIFKKELFKKTAKELLEEAKLVDTSAVLSEQTHKKEEPK
jgi:ribosomal protein S3